MAAIGKDSYDMTVSNNARSLGGGRNHEGEERSVLETVNNESSNIGSTLT